MTGLYPLAKGWSLSHVTRDNQSPTDTHHHVSLESSFNKLHQNIPQQWPHSTTHPSLQQTGTSSSPEAVSNNPFLPCNPPPLILLLLQLTLSRALSRAGKSVLQIDTNPYYGGQSTAFYSLPELALWASRVNLGHEPGFSNAAVYHADDVDGKRGYTVSLSPHLVYWHSTLLRLLRNADMTDSFSWQAVGSWWVWLTDEEVGVPAIGSSGVTVAELGIKAARVASTVTGAAGRRKAGWNKGRRKETAKEEPTKPVSEAGEQPTTLRRIAGNFREVPCTLEDVVWSTDLTDRDRGHLGEFLRFIMKHDSDAPDDQKYREMFDANRNRTLFEFVSTTFPLPPSAITSLSSLTLLPTPPIAMTLEAAVPKLAVHFESLGNIPDVRSAAALTVAYGGSTELCQVFSRAAAVAGGVNVLGRGVKRVEKLETEAETTAEADVKRRLQVELDNDETVKVDWIIGEDNTKVESEPEPESESVSMARAAYVVAGELPALFEKKYKDETITPAAAVVMVPIAGDGLPVYLVVHSAVTGECPRGQCILHAFTATPGEAGYEAIEGSVKKLLDNQDGSLPLTFSNCSFNANGYGRTVTNPILTKVYDYEYTHF